MPYATLEDLHARFGAQEIDAMAARSADPAQALDQALADADAEIDGYLAARYRLPLPVVPAALVRIACDIARYRLWSERASEEVRRRYEDARRFLEALARGDVRLMVGEDEPAAPQAMAAARTGDAPVFTRDGTKDF
ncbi:MAG: hypothetical protein KatS3mg124_1845 [Porticoccaceae bacterium]|nr:MAG: hypothetical protein KatS3mg124_1845 [Porticoccaceae bacterium]